jgi:hypothetical protein
MLKFTTKALKDRPTLNFQPGIYEWMSKMTIEELEEWEKSAFDRAKRMFEEQKREYRHEEAIAFVREEAKLIDRDYKLF